MPDPIDLAAMFFHLIAYADFIPTPGIEEDHPLVRAILTARQAITPTAVYIAA